MRLFWGTWSYLTNTSEPKWLLQILVTKTNQHNTCIFQQFVTQTPKQITCTGACTVYKFPTLFQTVPSKQTLILGLTSICTMINFSKFEFNFPDFLSDYIGGYIHLDAALYIKDCFPMFTGL